ncbi:helicase-exonuclease AddAB subunit AddA [Sporomusa acidovorans]|uniref:ATP-dependent helicase/nuclease subunit A n=1 Tax=Sporomusa acidovorans (strain ATCC 49682 / DSM 3132 / Mol) TaxID=1123286 RepID=A0ABZ3IW07_SPOA4|nr:helicase-exonuclease AddAB subunit AddA [Sporomusa acidovorans]OZC15262.1 ATP-dependent helicase/nuclease subunit A [Sporomusa acidovorans DSM 3132]SDE91529.1 DNA helicase/exodeoxyribonuclease V, subunit A [Sporomusa acidovorans]
MQCSAEQQAAIETRNCNLLVAAAAGSGKTWVLVERIISRIIDPEERLSVDRLLVVTFTNAAANEMRSRIGEALNDVLRQPELTDPELRRHVERQLVLLNAANISTLHAFCQSLVRQYFYLLGIEPNFRIANDTEITLIKSDVLETVFEQSYLEADPGFMTLIEHYGDEDGDNSLAGLVLKLYEFSRSHPWPEQWLAGLPNGFALPAEADFDNTPWSALVRDKIALEWEEARQLLLSLMAEAGRPGNPAAYAQTFAEDIQIMDNLLAAAQTSWIALDQALAAVKFPRIASVGKEVPKEVKDYFQGERNKAKRKVAEVKTVYFERSGQELIADLRQVEPLVAALVQLVQTFAGQYSRTKQAKGIVDFNDLEHLCLAVLRSADSGQGEGTPSTVAAQLKTRFAEIMVDEYQDINRVQEEIIRLVANDDQPNLFLVGDVKQSIYRFRLAEPALFMSKYVSYRRGEQAGCQRIDLSKNFRSRAGVLYAANFLFGQLMTEHTAELDYGQAEQLNPGPDYPACTGTSLDGPVELIMIDRDKDETERPLTDDETAGSQDAEEESENQPPPAAAGITEEELSAFEQEAVVIARRIRELMNGGYQVFDKQQGGYRPLMYRDIVILLRSVQGKAQAVQDRLRHDGIPCYAELDTGYFAETEIAIMLALLQVIDNPQQDIPLAAVLRSPLLGLAGDELAEIRLCQEQGSLWTAVQTYGQTPAVSHTVREFLDKLAVWRNLARRKGVADLIWRIYQDTGYYDYVGGMPGGLLRQANLRALYDRARQYEATNFRGLFRFLRFIERLKNKESDLSVARALGESEDVVRVMSIHKSKGLEFPVVIVADMGKNFNLMDTTALVLCHKELGVGPYVTMPELRFRYPTPARWGIAHKIELETKAEEQRILYVALTRAREKLILVGSAKKLARRCTAWCRSVGELSAKLPASQVIKARSYLDWVGMAVARHLDGALIRQYGGCDDQPVTNLAGNQSAWNVTIIKAPDLQSAEASSEADGELLAAVRQLEPVAGGTDTKWVSDRLNWQYPCSAAVSKPAKLSVSEIKRRLELVERDEAETVFAPKPSTVHVRPRFLQATSKLTPVEYGVMLHTVMQHIDLAGELSEKAVTEQISALEIRRILPVGQAAAVDIDLIRAFFSSPLGRRLTGAKQVWREMPFSLLLPAERFYADLQGCGEQIFVQGIIDCLFAEDDGLVLIDYKTDHGISPRELVDRYAAQLSMYSLAIERILGRPVKEQYIYAFGLGREIKLEALG